MQCDIGMASGRMCNSQARLSYKTVRILKSQHNKTKSESSSTTWLPGLVRGRWKLLCVQLPPLSLLGHCDRGKEHMRISACPSVLQLESSLYSFFP